MRGRGAVQTPATLRGPGEDRCPGCRASGPVDPAGPNHPVRVPVPSQEAAQDLVRAREDVRADLMRARNRLSKLLLRHGLVSSGGDAWTGAHHTWLHRQRAIRQ